MIVGFIGGIGSGKTLSMTKSLHEDYKKGATIYTNYGLKFKKRSKVIPLDKEFFEDYQKSGLDLINSSIAIDEAHVFVDSRRSLSKKNKLFSKFLTQSRKRSVNLYYTTQEADIKNFFTSGQVDLRLRKLTDYLVFCEFINIGKRHYVRNIMYSNQKKIGMTIFNADDYFKMYDTNEIIDIE